MRQLGGDVVVLQASELQLGRGETVADTARVLSRYVDAIMLRTDDAGKLAELAANATVPVINGLTDKSHPCQLMADVMTFEEHRGPIAGQVVAWVGDGNNVARSWIEAAVQFGFTPAHRLPAGVAARAGSLGLGAITRRQHHGGQRSRGGGGRRALRGHGLLGQHGGRPDLQPAQPIGAVSGGRAADGPRGR